MVVRKPTHENWGWTSREVMFSYENPPHKQREVRYSKGGSSSPCQKEIRMTPANPTYNHHPSVKQQRLFKPGIQMTLAFYWKRALFWKVVSHKNSKTSRFQVYKYPLVNQHGNRKWTFWRCIPYWKWEFSIAMLVYQRVTMKSCIKTSLQTPNHRGFPPG